jgi:hypothetical protein
MGYGTTITLDDASVEAIARRVHELLTEERPRGSGASVVDAVEVARRVGRTRSWVYANADRLGGLRLGDGPRPRLMFDLAEVEARLREGMRARATDEPGRLRIGRPPRRKRVLPEAELLPIGPARPRSRRPDGA